MVMPKSILALAGAVVLAVAIGCSGTEETETSGTTGDTGEEPVAMVTAADVMDIVNTRCVTCHKGADAPEDLEMDTIEGLLKGGEHGPIVNPGDAAGSLMIKVMRGVEGVPKMPPQGDPVPEDEIKKVEEWINAGANPN